MAAPTTNPTLCATKDMSRHAPRNMENLDNSHGCAVKKYTIVT